MIADSATILGLVADTHCAAADGSDLPDEVVEALADCDLIVHLGDLTTPGVLDRLAATGAEVIGVRNPDLDPPAAEDVRLVDGPVWRDIGGRTVAFTRSIPLAGERADVIAYGVPAGGGGHDHRIAVVDGVLLVTPGSPTYPVRHRTVARVTVNADGVDAEIVHLR